MLVWIDLETSGLDPIKDHVLEVACIVTKDDCELTEVARFHAVTSEACRVDWSSVPKVVLDMHVKNGLLVESLQARLTPLNCLNTQYIEPRIEAVDTALSHWLANLGVDRPELAGSTISFDREFMRHHLPGTLSLLHYHNLDVSSISQAAKRLWPSVYEKRPRSEDKKHRAVPDIEYSLELARYYAKALGSVPRE